MEKFSQELLSLDKFLLRVGRFALRAAGIFLLGIIPGIVGFMMTEGLSFAESALNAVSMAGSQGVHFPPVSTGGKYFNALYGFYLQAVFFVALGVLISPFVHRIIHRWHLDSDTTT
ncbi:hypothetical protein ACOY5P_17450 [Enterobacter asburiae]|uniref:hypothetical protein n=1 Tax=Enterobacterales TaxID=91347 RepID=UPI0013D941FD|nr:hypothetical protein [Serratia marcescens]